MAIVEIDSEDLAIILNTIENAVNDLSNMTEEGVQDIHDYTMELAYAKRLIQGAIERSERK